MMTKEQIKEAKRLARNYRKRKRYAKNREKILEQRRQYRLKNREEINRKRRERYKKEKEKLKQIRQKIREKQLLLEEKIKKEKEKQEKANIYKITMQFCKLFNVNYLNYNCFYDEKDNYYTYDKEKKQYITENGKVFNKKIFIR